MTTIKLGDQSPDWRLPTLEGGSLSLSDHAGKRVLLFFWGSW